eukprot:gb/GECG01013412.1/.p1 GENE.gb/GECG01013412.1/~~gb/GECG01013412.1/.p1  ORF type:complete len:666 (+),score=113.24 gb/GECG01013412.1/:1-1998(+)
MMSADAFRGPGGAAAGVYSSNKDSEGYVAQDEELGESSLGGASSTSARSNANIQQRLLDKFQRFSANGESGYVKKKLLTSSNIIMMILGLGILMMFLYFLAAVSFVGSSESPDLAAEHSRNPTMQRNPPSILASKQTQEDRSLEKDNKEDTGTPRMRGASKPDDAGKENTKKNRQIYKPGTVAEGTESDQEWDRSVNKGSISNDGGKSRVDTAAFNHQDASAEQKELSRKSETPTEQEPSSLDKAPEAAADNKATKLEDGTVGESKSSTKQQADSKKETEQTLSTQSVARNRIADGGEQKATAEEEESLRRLLADTSPKYTSHAVGYLPKLAEDQEKKAAIASAFWHAWDGYKKFAYGKDTLRPVSRRGDDSFLGMGITILDSLDTMIVMGYVDEFWNHVSWLNDNMYFVKQRGVSLFESTIRVLGGILSAYDWSDEKNMGRLTSSSPQKPLSVENRRQTRSALLKKGEELAQALMPCFDTITGLPYSTIDLGTGRTSNPGGSSTTSEVGTIQLEWERLARLTGNEKFGKVARRTMDKLKEIEPSDGLWPIWVDPGNGKFTSQTATLGARGDSIYEYILKQWVVQGGLDRRRASVWTGSFSISSDPSVDNQHLLKLREMYDRSVASIKSQLVRRTSGKKPLTYIAERVGGSVNNKMDHLVCFAGG